MKAVVLHSYDGIPALTVEDRPLPEPGKGEVVVKIAAASINPADLMFIQGQYGFKKPLPTVPGFEGTGTITAVGEGVNPDQWVGKRVTCVSGSSGDGTWIEYMAVPVALCSPIQDSVTDEQGTTLFINPLSAWAMIDITKQRGVKAIVQTAAGSALGQMIWRLAAQQGIETINIVRRAEQAEELRAAGMANVLVSSADDFDSALRDLAKSLNATLAFDAVGGEMCDRVLRALPNGSTLVLYGNLSMETPLIGADQLIFRNKSVDGFWLIDWLGAQDGARMGEIWGQVQEFAGNVLSSEIRARYSLEQVTDALTLYSQQMSGGKLLFVPGQ
jgi:NADPH:quinone reductase